MSQPRITNSKRNRKEAALSPPESNQQSKRPSIIEKMDLEQISQLLDKKLQPIADKLELLGDVIHKNTQLEKRIGDQDKKIAAMQKEIEFLRMAAAGKNLIFKNVTWGNHEGTQDLGVKEFCKDVLKMTENIEIENAHFIDKKKKVMCVEFRSNHMSRSVLKSAINLKGTNMRIEKDYPRSIRVKNSKLLAVRKELNKSFRNCKIRVVNGSMWFQNKKFTWDLEKGLLVDERDGVKYLQEELGLEISSLVERLKTEDNGVRGQDVQGLE